MTFDPEHVSPPGARIKVLGVGGGGGNAVNTMIKGGVEGVDFITCNTDVQSLRFSLADYKIQIGKELTRGLGAGADPDVGRDAALEDRHEIQEYLQGADMVFITAGMGGGTGTGGASVVAQIARELGALTVAVVTKPFGFEGKRRRKHADVGIARLRECVDTLITIPNQRLLQVAQPGLSMIDAFKMADEVLVNAVRGISDIINIPGTVNVDFADVKTVMSCMGQALMGIGRASGENRALEAARQAISSPLLEDIDIEGATGILINITAGSDITLMEVNEACSIIQEAAHEDANIIFGAVIDESLGDEIRVTVIATGFPVDTDEVEDPTNKTTPSVLQQFGTRLTTAAVAPKPVTRSAPQPQHYSPLTTKRPVTTSQQQAATAAPAAAAVPTGATVSSAAPAVTPAAPMAAPAIKPASPELGHGLIESKPAPRLDLSADLAPRSEPMPPQVSQVATSTTSSTTAQATTPNAQEAAKFNSDEAAELMRWTLDGFDDESLSLAQPAVEVEASFDAPFAESISIEPSFEEHAASNPSAHLTQQNAQTQSSQDPSESVENKSQSTDSQDTTARLQGARIIDDPRDDFTPRQLLGDVAPTSVFAEEDGLSVAPETAVTGAAIDGASIGNDSDAAAPLESFFEEETALIASDIDRKIDEALQLAERMKLPKSQPQTDDLDVPAFLRNGLKDLPFG